MALAKHIKEKVQKFGHILAAVIILLHAYEKYEEREDVYVFFLVAGLVFLLVAITHHQLAKIFIYADGIFLTIESVVYAVIAVEYFHLHKKGLPWLYVFATIGYLIAAFIKGRKAREASSLHTEQQHDDGRHH